MKTDRFTGRGVARLLLLALLGSAAVQAQPPLPRGGQGWEDAPRWDEQRRAVMQERVREWRERSPEERALIRERFEDFRRLRPEQQQRMQERFREFQAMPEAERRALRERFRESQAAPEAERRGMRGRFRDRRGAAPFAPGQGPGPD